MMEALHLDVFGTALAGFFAIMNPLANTPIFLGLTEGLSAAQRRKVASKASLVAFFVVALFALLGQLIFSVFGITSGAFRVAGGIIVFLIGYRMLQGEHSSLHQTKRAKQAAEALVRKSIASGFEHVTDDVGPKSVASRDEESAVSVAVTPLGVQLLAGPGTIATAVGFSAGHWEDAAVTILAFATLCLGTWLSFVMGTHIVRTLGHSALTVVTRLMGLILAVIGAQMFLHGLREAGF